MRELPLVPLPVLAVTPDQAAAMCNVSRSRVDEWTHRTGFPVIRDGKAVLIPLEPLRQWLADQARADELTALPVVKTMLARNVRRAGNYSI